VLKEMVAVLEVSRPSINVEYAWLQFTTARVRVLYSIEAATGLVTVHDIADKFTAVKAV
jgi:hypothetical protein